MDEQNSFETVLDWIERARRAQDLVGKVDLTRVAQHDAQELDKLCRVTGALETLSCGEDVEYLPGVDDDEVPELDPREIHRAELMELLAEEGLGERLGRVFVAGALAGSEDSLRPLDLIPHQQGLPDFHICVAPEFATTDGAQGVFVSERGVFAAMIPNPMTRHKWRITRSRPFDDDQEMIVTLKRFISRNAH